jgi:tryptophan synthase alpha chain
MNRIQQLFTTKKNNILSVFCTAGFPAVDSIVPILESLQENGVDMIEIGMPFSDPTADGPVIQYSNTIAINNGMTLEVLFAQLKNIREKVQVPLILMGYVNPVLQYGLENFLSDAQACGIDGVIIPDLPMYEYETFYIDTFRKYDLQNIFLITPQTSGERVRKVDSLSDAFIYMVSSNAITGANAAIEQQQLEYYQRIKDMQLKNPTVIGFGIRDKATFDTACQYANGAIIGTAFIKAIDGKDNIPEAITAFIQQVKA